MRTSTVCHMLCRKFGYLRVLRPLQPKAVFTQRISLSTSVQLQGWKKDNFGGSRLESVLKTVGFNGFTVNEKQDLDHSAVRLYISCSEYSDFPQFKERFGLKDTFIAWTDLLFLHIWMLNMRIANHSAKNLDTDCIFLSKRIQYHMWMDINKRAKKIARGSILRKSLRGLSDHYLGLVFTYDVAYHSNDKALAGAIWNCLLNCNEDVEPKDLLHLVDYIHKNMHHLETLGNEQFFNGVASFIPLDSDVADVEKDMRVQEILSVLP